jgi:hypothetical protein
VLLLVDRALVGVVMARPHAAGAAAAAGDVAAELEASHGR